MPSDDADRPADRSGRSGSGPVPPRPRQATMAGWIIAVGSGLLVVSAFERVAGLSSLETQEAVREFLAEPPGSGLGLSEQGARSALRALMLLGGACAAAAAVLGGYVLGRSHGARLGLSILALPLLVGGFAISSLLAAVVVGSIVLLWVQPTSSWFRGEAAPEPPTRREARRTEAPPAETPPPVPASALSSGATGPAPSAGAPSAQPPGMAWPPAPAGEPAEAPFAGRAPQGFGAEAGRRPGSVLAACLVTWISSGLVAVFVGLTAVSLLVVPDVMFDELRRQDPELLTSSGMTEGEVRTGTLVFCLIALAWCVAAAVFAAFTFRGAAWGRTALLVSAGVLGGLSLVMLLASLAMLVPLAASAVTVGLLLRPETRAWCRRAPRGRVS